MARTRRHEITDPPEQPFEYEPGPLFVPPADMPVVWSTSSRMTRTRVEGGWRFDPAPDPSFRDLRDEPLYRAGLTLIAGGMP